MVHFDDAQGIAWRYSWSKHSAEELKISPKGVGQEGKVVPDALDHPVFSYLVKPMRTGYSKSKETKR